MREPGQKELGLMDEEATRPGAVVPGSSGQGVSPSDAQVPVLQPWLPGWSRSLHVLFAP